MSVPTRWKWRLPLPVVCFSPQSATSGRNRAVCPLAAVRYHKNKSAVFILTDRGSGETYVHPAKAVGESTIRLLLCDRQLESLTVYTDGFRAYEPLDGDDTLDQQYVIHGEGEYADGDVHVNTCESHASLVRRCPIKALSSTNSLSTSERFSYGSTSVLNSVSKHSKLSSKRRYDGTNNRLPESVTRIKRRT